ncbi:MAG: PorP/SprF family type IX secretion system membrane protein [Ferruginibacter sp.]|nr:PorP/SprF family type IX secretion system membrane protein [Ferruginibacter sp.]
MKALKICSLILGLSLMGQGVSAQVDPHFTQYYVYPSWLNPALTGVFDGDVRISGIYRTQWGNITSPFSTPGLAVDFSTNKNANFGISVLNQTAGDGGYNYTTAYGNAAYTGIRFGANETHRVVIGLQFGLIQRKFNPDKLTFGDQWNPITGYNPSNPTAEALKTHNTSSFDMGAGVLYFDGTPGKRVNFYAGFAVSHLTRPKDQFSGKDDAIIPMRYTGHLGARIAVNDMFSITPNVLYLRQGTAEEKMAGAYGQFKVAPLTDFMLGANYRFEDAISPFAGVSHKNLLFGLSYDINTSDLGSMAKGSNSFEVSMSYIIRKRTKTPEAEFVCPRL